jgi:hypothetical protein
MRTFRMHVFEGSGNRFVFMTRYSYYLDDPDRPMTPDYDCSNFTLMLGNGLRYTGEHVDVSCEGDEILFEHVRGTMASPRFEHGRCHVYFISGPVFDDAKANPD